MFSVYAFSIKMQASPGTACPLSANIMTMFAK